MLSILSFELFSVGVKMHHLFSNNSGKPDSGPDSSVPAIG
jgi:hypothetical protein